MITAPTLLRRTATSRGVVRALEPPFLVFVFGLGVIVAAANYNGLATGIHGVLPSGQSLSDLLIIAALSAVLANLLNNLPAILILAPALAPIGHGPVLAALIGVNIGPISPTWARLPHYCGAGSCAPTRPQSSGGCSSGSGPRQCQRRSRLRPCSFGSRSRAVSKDPRARLDRRGQLEGHDRGGGCVPPGRERDHAPACTSERARSGCPRGAPRPARPPASKTSRVGADNPRGRRATAPRRRAGTAWA